jgi:hypothetical protein
MNTTNINATPARRFVARLRFNRSLRDIREGLIVLPQQEQPPTTVSAIDKAAPSATTVTKLALSRKEAAQQLSVSQRAFDRWVAAGLIHPSGVGRRKIFAVAELHRFLAETSKTIEL